MRLMVTNIIKRGSMTTVRVRASLMLAPFINNVTSGSTIQTSN
jgi:hypothetical protein